MDASTKYMEKCMAGIATDDEEGGEEEQGPEYVTKRWEGKMVLSRRRSHQVWRIWTGTLNCSNSWLLRPHPSVVVQISL